MRVLIVEDDQNLIDALAHILEEANYQVDTAMNGMDGLYFASNEEYDIIVLDVMLPKMNGFEVIKMLRKQGIATPTIMLTAASEIEDKITGLDSGADDYMVKPFVPEELLARLRALSRRKGEVITDELTFEDITLNLQTYTLSTSLKSVTLSNREFSILSLFMENPTAIVSKEQIIVKVWGYDADTTDNNVEAYISFLRKKLFYVGSKVNIIALRMVGYRLELDKDD